MTRARLLPIALLGAALLAAGPARAAVTKELALEDLSKRADLIVQGTAEGTEARWSEDGKRIQSTTRIRVSKSVKGQGGPTVEVRHPGGTVGEITQRVAGAPRFDPGEEVILFLKCAPGQRKKETFVVDGFAQGKFNVVRGEDGSRKVVRATPGLSLLGPDGKLRAAGPTEPMSEAAFLDRVRSAAK